MTWHKMGTRIKDNQGRTKMGHPSDGNAWKNFDRKCPTGAELDTLLKEGAPEVKINFVSWFMKKVISNLSLLPSNL